MRRFYQPNHRICNVALSTLAIILVCCIDCRAQSTVGIEFFMNDTTENSDATTRSSSSSSHISTLRHTKSTTSHHHQTAEEVVDRGGVRVSLMNNETDLFATLPSTNVNDDSFVDENVVTVMSPMDNKPMVASSSSSTAEGLLQLASQAQPLVMDAPTKASELATTNNIISFDENSSSNVTNATISSTTKPFLLPFTIPTLRPRIVHQRPYSKHHHNHLWGPFFEEPATNNNANGTIHVGYHYGTEAILNCRVGMLKDKTVMWLQRTTEKVSLLTVGNVTYSGDPRISVKFQYPNNWRLHINPLRNEDGGLYMCQVSTHPPKVLTTNLTVLPPAVRVVDEMGYDVNDRYYKLGSLVDITCQVAVSFMATLPPVASEGPKQIKTGANVIGTDAKDTSHSSTSKERLHYLNHKIEWKKDGESLPADVKISLSISKNWKNSRLTILHAYKSHSGTYTCTVFNASTAAAHVQVLNGETPAAVHHNAGTCISINNNYFLSILMVFLIVLSVPKFYGTIRFCNTATP